MTERWQTVAGWPYEVSDLGRVRNMRTGRILKPDYPNGYARVTFALEGRIARFMVHHLVCYAFNGPPPEGTECVRHLDGKPRNIRWDNLAYGTRSDNERDKRRHGTYQEGEGNPFSRLKKHEVEDIRRRHAINKAARNAAGFAYVERGFVADLAAEYGVSLSCVKLVLQNRNWKN